MRQDATAGRFHNFHEPPAGSLRLGSAALSADSNGQAAVPEERVGDQIFS
jgi:hypothetical protein